MFSSHSKPQGANQDVEVRLLDVQRIGVDEATNNHLPLEPQPGHVDFLLAAQVAPRALPFVQRCSRHTHHDGFEIHVKKVKFRLVPRSEPTRLLENHARLMPIWPDNCELFVTRLVSHGGLSSPTLPVVKIQRSEEHT